MIIDGLNGYLNAMPDERFVILQMHELRNYLSQGGILTILGRGKQVSKGAPFISKRIARSASRSASGPRIDQQFRELSRGYCCLPNARSRH
jgi:hypothetical protein